MNPSERSDIGAPPMVVQQYARYPPTLEPGLQSASSLGSARSRMAASKSPPLHRKATPRSIQSSPTVPRPAIPPSSAARSGPSMSPPVYDPLRQRQPPRESLDQAESRSLPSRDITDETIDDAYVMFIFYCNPNVPLSVDTSELRKTFRCPPRSDGKSFSIFTLWELIRKLDSKELKTWISLATELGVEPPDLEQGQSTQKVQQYAVRLKVGPGFYSVMGSLLNYHSAGCERCMLMLSLNIASDILILIILSFLPIMQWSARVATECL